MNVLVSILKFPPDFTGAGLRISQMYGNLQQKGDLDRVFVITTGALAGNRTNSGQSRHLAVRYVGGNRYPGAARRTSERLRKAIYVLRAGAVAIIQYLRLFRKVDLVHTVDSSWLSTIIGWCCWASGKPFVKEIVLLGADDPVSIARNKVNPLRFLFLFPFQAARLLIVLSDRLKRSCLAMGIPTERIWYRLNPVYLDPTGSRLDTSRLHARLDPAKDWILHVGRISRRKNIDFLLRSAAYLQREVQLVFAGPWDDAGYQKEIIDSADRLRDQSGGRVSAVFLGRITDRKQLAGLFAEANLFWFASRSEGMPNAVLESLVAGTPVVTLSVEGIIAEVIEQGENGEIIDSTDPAVFGAAVDHWLSRDDIDRDQIGLLARQRFDAGKIEQAYVRRFREVAAAANRP